MWDGGSVPMLPLFLLRTILLHPVSVSYTHLLGDNESPCKCIETAGCPAVLRRGFRKEQVTGMLQIRPLVEMAFETAAQKAQVFLADIRFISSKNMPKAASCPSIIMKRERWMRSARSPTGRHPWPSSAIPTAMRRLFFPC